MFLIFANATPRRTIITNNRTIIQTWRRRFWRWLRHPYWCRGAINVYRRRTTGRTRKGIWCDVTEWRCGRKKWSTGIRGYVRENWIRWSRLTCRHKNTVNNGLGDRYLLCPYREYTDRRAEERVWSRSLQGSESEGNQDTGTSGRKRDGDGEVEGRIWQIGCVAFGGLPYREKKQLKAVLDSIRE